MKRFLPLALLFALVLALPLRSADPPKADPPVPAAIHLPVSPVVPLPAPAPVTKLAAGQLYIVTCDAPLFIIASPDGLVSVKSVKTPATLFGNFVDLQPGDDDGRTYPAATNVYLVRAAGVGRVELIVTTDLTSKPLRRVLDVDNGAPPKPPDPPTPTDPLTVAIQAAFAADTDPAKTANVAKLAALYKAGIKTVNDPTVKTYGDLFGDMKTASAATMPVGAIPKVRAAVGSYLNGVTGNDTSKAIDRATTTAAFLKVATAMEGLVK